MHHESPSGLTPLKRLVKIEGPTHEHHLDYLLRRIVSWADDALASEQERGKRARAARPGGLCNGLVQEERGEVQKLSYTSSSQATVARDGKLDESRNASMTLQTSLS